MVQLDLFATERPPPPTIPPSPAVEAAASFEGRRRRLRSGVVYVPPFKTGPISDATGGPLSGEEAERVIRRETIHLAGYRWQDGTTCCRGCMDEFQKRGLEQGRGHRMNAWASLYAPCAVCGSRTGAASTG